MVVLLRRQANWLVLGEVVLLVETTVNRFGAVEAGRTVAAGAAAALDGADGFSRGVAG